MTTKTELEADLKNAIRSGDDLRKRTLRMVLTAIRLAEAEEGIPPDEAAIQAILYKEVKSRHEAISDAQRAGRADLIPDSEAEIAFLETYLPKKMSAEELEQIVRAAIAESSASSLKEMGQVMKLVLPRVQGRVEGSQVNQVVRKLLGS